MKVSIWVGRTKTGGMHVERLFLDLLVDLDGVLFGNFAIWCIFSKKDGTFSPLDYCDEPCFSGGNTSEFRSHYNAKLLENCYWTCFAFSLHRFLYTSNRMFSFYISVISYATICCVDNCWYTMLLLMSKPRTVWLPAKWFGKICLCTA